MDKHSRSTQKMFKNSAQNPRIVKKYIATNATVTVLTIVVLVTTTMFAKRLINAKILIRLY